MVETLNRKSKMGCPVAQLTGFIGRDRTSHDKKLVHFKWTKKDYYFCFPHFNFSPNHVSILFSAVEEYYHVSILLKLFIRTAKRSHNESFKITIVQSRRDVNPGIFLSSCLSSGFSPEQQISFLALFG